MRRHLQVNFGTALAMRCASKRIGQNIPLKLPITIFIVVDDRIIRSNEFRKPNAIRHSVPPPSPLSSCLPPNFFGDHYLAWEKISGDCGIRLIGDRRGKMSLI